MARYVAYFRVSTAAQGRSGLGLAAQRARIADFVGENDEILAEHVEVQSGRSDTREELWKAIATAKRLSAKVLIAKLDRFSRKVSFIAGIMEQGVGLVVADMPNATDFQLHIFAALAQEERRLIDHAPIMPKVTAKAGARGWLSLTEYRTLLRECERHEKLGMKVRTHVITAELRRFCKFSVNTFLRPSDAKQLKHKHIEIVCNGNRKCLRITTPFSKTVASPIISMPNAIEVYEQLLNASKEAGYGQPDDYVFMPQYQNRAFVIRSISRQLRMVLRSAGLY